jgi:hypothetical protein
VSERSARRLVGLPVWVGGVHVGEVADLLLATNLAVVHGAVVETRSTGQYFLPWVTCRVEDERVYAATALSLLGEVELAFYLESSTRLSRLSGLAVTERDGGTSTVSDVLFTRAGTVTEFELAGGGVWRRVPFADAHLRRDAERLLELTLSARAA